MNLGDEQDKETMTRIDDIQTIQFLVKRKRFLD